MLHIPPFNFSRLTSTRKYTFSSHPPDVVKLLVPPGGTPDTLHLLLAGGLAGMTSTIFCYPLDLVRAILTVQTTEQKYKGMLDALKSIYRAKGIVGLYKGLPATLMGIAPYVAINFAVFDKLKRKFLPDKKSKYFDLTNLGLGALAGGIASAITYPTDVIRRRMQLVGTGTVELPPYRNTWDCIKTVYRTEGAGGLYKGLAPGMLKVVPSVAIAFMTYERLRVVLKFEGKAPSGG